MIDNSNASVNNVMDGISIVEGKGVGKAYFVGRSIVNEDVVNISRQDVGDNIMRFNEVRKKAKEEYRKYQEENNTSLSFDSSIMKIYQNIIDDPAFVGQVVDSISNNLHDVETAIKSVSNDFIKRFNAAGTSYFKERSSDMVEVCEKLISYLHVDDGRPKVFANNIVLVVLRAFTPSDILSCDIEKIAGIVSISGGKTSHAAIIARSHSIPVVSGIRNLSKMIRPGDELYVDADEAKVYIKPDEDIKAHLSKKSKKSTQIIRTLKEKWNRPVYSKDGVPFTVLANVALPEDAEVALNYGADGIGLVRTEYLLSNRKQFPSETDQILYYRSILENLKNKECIIRMMDIGGDKVPEFFNMPAEFNPFMGWRAIRILLERRDIFELQLRSIMTAGEDREYKIMFPMVTLRDEWYEAKKFVKEVADKMGVKVPECGVLFEVPLAILEIGSFMKEMDFASIGTNDLLQYLCAADRNNPKVNHLYNPVEPAFLKILREAIIASRDEGVPLSICGEMAGDLRNTVILAGLGLRRFSVIPKAIPRIKEILSKINVSEINESLIHLDAVKTSEGMKKWVDNLNKEVLEDITLDNISSY